MTLLREPDSTLQARLEEAQKELEQMRKKAPNGLLKLSEQILTYSGDIGEDVCEDFWDKANRIELDDCEWGDKVRICWNLDGERFSDIGYLTTVPFVLDEETPEFSRVIHVPTPQNPGGKDQPCGEWVTVFDAITNPYIVSIKPLRRRQ